MNTLIKNFKSNSDIKVEDVCSNVSIDVLPDKTHVRIETVADDVLVDYTGAITSSTFVGELIYIMPIIEEDGVDLIESDIMAYFKHPDFYKLTIGFETTLDNTVIVQSFDHLKIVTYEPISRRRKTFLN